MIVKIVESSPVRTFIAMNRVGKEELLQAIARRTSLKVIYIIYIFFPVRYKLLP